jgi:S1-C subfamily serine protease
MSKCAILSIFLLVFLPTATIAATSSGSGVLIGPHGEVLTVAHVVKKCRTITAQLPLQAAASATIVAIDTQNDLALLNTKVQNKEFASLRVGNLAKPGESIVVAGYPLPGILSSEINITTGVVSSDAGLLDDVRYYQISAPVQPGNSGGPLFDISGNILGLVAAKLDFRVAGIIGALPENVNFAVKSDMAAIFLNSVGAKFRSISAATHQNGSTVSELSRKVTVHVVCDDERFSSSTSSKQAPAKRTKAKNQSDWKKNFHPDWLGH